MTLTALPPRRHAVRPSRAVHRRAAFRFDICRHIAQISQLSGLGLAKEATPGVAVPPTMFLPFWAPKDQDKIKAMKDTSFRANDTNLQGVYPGPADSVFACSTYAYPEETGFLLRSMGFVDTVTAAPSATTLAAAATPAAPGTPQTISLAVAAVAGQVLTIAGTTSPVVAPEARYVVVGGVTPTLNAPLSSSHPSGTAVTYAMKHSFAQAAYPQPQPPSYTLTDIEVARTRAYPGCKMAQLDIKIDGGDQITLSPSWVGYPGVAAPTPTIAVTAREPLLGWQWVSSLGAPGTGNVTRYFSVDLSLKRPTEPLHTGDATQGPREIVAADLDVTGKISALFEDTTDADIFNNYIQTNGLTLAITSGRTGAGWVISIAKPNFATFGPDRGSSYAKTEIDLNGIFNATDGGAMSMQLFNSQAATY